MWSYMTLLTLMLPLIVTSKYDFGYTECRHHPYKAVCLGTSIIPLRQENQRLTEIPTLKRQESCVKLKQNWITRFPSNLDNLKSVVTLDLSLNRITALPDDMNVMSKLEILDVSNNKIATLSPKTRFPVSLRGLLLAENDMKTIPAGIEIPGLFVLDLSNNLFTEIPFEFCVSDQLIRVDFSGNPIQNDVSHYIHTVNRCKNFNNIPFCLFTPSKQMTCTCESLAQLLIAKPSFCLGSSKMKPHEAMQCSNKDSYRKYQGDLIFDLNVKQVKDNCSYAMVTDTSTGHGLTAVSHSIAMVLALVGSWVFVI